MNQAFCVCSLESVSERDAQIEQRTDVERTAGETCGERFALESFHDEKGPVLELANVVDGADVRMIQGGDGLRLALETRDREIIGALADRQNLDGNITPQPGVVGEIHLAHAACAQQPLNLVRAEARPWLYSHR